MMPRLFNSDAVSESLSFILLTAIMLIAFFVVYSAGLPAYSTYLDQSHMTNVEQSFSIIAYNGNTVAMHKSPFSSSELKIFGGTLATRDAGYMDISYYGDTGGTSLIGSNNTTLKVLEYTKGTDRVAYIDGGVCRYYPTGSVMLTDPPIHTTPDSLIVPTITVYNSDVSVAGNGLTRILFLTPYYSKMSQTISLPTAASFDVKRIDIRMKSEYADAFGRYFAETLGFTQSEGPDGEVIVSKSYPSGIRLQLIQSYLTIEAN
ncbi:DUF7289 family protein [Methanocella arvoryzae]|nr:hypothetical protein [Methanocella arvoryzae]